MKKVLFFLAFGLFVCVSIASAQPRPSVNASTVSVIKKSADASVEARYDGGMFGFNDKVKGTLKFDELNERLVFFGEDNKEKFAIPYASILVISPNTSKVQSGAGRTVSAIPIPGAGIGGGFMKKKKNYMVIQFRDPDVDVHGSANFLIDTNELLLSTINALGEKAKLTKRGDAYYRPKAAAKSEI